ncbi:DNA replication protein [Candidatus Pelagibacter sp. Uisw_134_02]|jgi:chromosomal replication initiation ATPase DnaA|uniref:DNA replication protein n=1 Tax=Candidatus Pelagibacter sp. Uisw_134_02 TaxID=3230990 RepID=UPI0039EBBDF3
MKSLNQLLLDFDYEQNFKDDDFYVGKSNFYAFELMNNWPKWEKNFINIIGEKFSGKTHLTDIFLKKFGGIRIETNFFDDENLKTIKPYQNVVLENFDLDVNEKLIYSLFNIIDQDNKFLIITSSEPVAKIDFKLEDLKSRTKNCLLAKIENPDDELMFALILKNLSDRQISLDKRLIDFIIKRVDRSYGKIFEFIYKIDEISLKKKKSIDFKIINEALENK